MMNLRVKRVLLRLIFIVIVATKFTDLSPVSLDLSQRLEDVLPYDSSLEQGVLTNGLKFYIRKNERPQNQAFFALLVNVGFIHELDDEQGIAHFVEHMVYKGSTNFKDYKELAAYFNARGIDLGPDMNAYTTMDHTEYSFTIPSNDADLTAKSITTLGDFAGRALFKKKAINDERAIILDEGQMRSSFGRRELVAMLKFIFQGSIYALRFPGGNDETVKTAPTSTIHNFYKKWYTPDNMAFIAVGDFEPTEIKKLMEGAFNGITAQSEKAIKDFNTTPKPPHKTAMFYVDKENKASSLEIIFEIEENKDETLDDMKKTLANALVNIILKERMKIFSYKSDCNTHEFTQSLSYNLFGCPNFSCNSAAACFKESKSLESAQELVMLIKQLKDHGIYEDELSWAKKIIISSGESMLANVKTLPHSTYASWYKINFFKKNHKLLADIPATIALEKKLIEEISLDDIHQAITSLFNFDKALYCISLNDDEYKKIGEQQGESTFFEKITKETSKETIPFEKPQHIQITPELTLIDQTPAFIENITSIDAQKITLANGVIVYFKRTNFSQDSLAIKGIALGGLDSVTSNPAAYALACDAIGEMGYGGIKPYQWAKIFREKPQLNSSYAIGLHERGVLASCRKEDLALCLHLVLTEMTLPNRDEEFFSFFLEKVREEIKQKNRSIPSLFSEKTTKTIYQHSLLFHPLTIENVDSINLDEIVRIYKQAFSNVAEFTFAISGNIEIDELITILNGTIGKMPASSERSWTTQPVTVLFPEKSLDETFDLQLEQQTIVKTIFPFSSLSSLETGHLLMVYEDLLSKRLFDVLRLDEGSTYSPNVDTMDLNSIFMDYNDDSGRLSITISCNKENTDLIKKQLLSVMKKISQDGFTSEEIVNAKKIAQNHTIQAFKCNKSWNAYMLSRHIRANGHLDSIESICQEIENFSEEKINLFAKNLINPDHFFIHRLIAKS